MGAQLPLSAFWFLYLGALGVFFPFYTLYLNENAGLSGSQVGLVVSMLQLVGILAQPVWGQVADRTGSRGRVLAGLAIGATLGFVLLYHARGFGWLLLCTAVLAVFHQAVIPMCMSVTIATLRDAGRWAFGLTRMWGTVGFGVMVVGFPYLLRVWQDAGGLAAEPGGPSEPGLEVMFLWIAGLAAAAACVALLLPRTGAVSLRAEPGAWRELIRHGPFVRFLLWSVGVYFCLQGPMSLFPIFVRAQGGSLEDVSNMWVLMLLLEVPLVALSSASLARLGPRGLLALGIGCGALRWLVSGSTDDLRVLYAAQLLHGPTVAGLVIGGPLYVDAAVPERLRSTGQATAAIFGVGLGGMLSNIVGGQLIEHVSPSAPALYGGIGALVLSLLLWRVLPRPRRPGEPEALR